MLIDQCFHLQQYDTKKCELLVTSSKRSSRCEDCDRYRCTLRAMASRKRKQDSTQRTELPSHINIRYLTDKETTERIKRQKCELKRTCEMKDRVVKKLKEMNEEVGVYVQKGLDEDLHTIITDGSVASPQNDSFKQIFWEQQLKAAQLALS